MIADKKGSPSDPDRDLRFTPAVLMNRRRKRSLRKWLFRVGGLIMLSIVTYFLILTPERRFTRSLERQIRRGYGTVIHFQEITPFEWQRVYIFSPYTPLAQIRKSLGFEWHGADNSGIDQGNLIHLVVFVSSQQVVADFQYLFAEANFSDDASNRDYTPSNAVFVVTPRPDDGMFLLRSAIVSSTATVAPIQPP